MKGRQHPHRGTRCPGLPPRNPLPLPTQTPTLYLPEIPTPQFTKTTHNHLDLSPCIFQPTLPPVYVWTPPAAGCLSPPDKVLRTKETGPRCRRRPGLHGGTRIGKREKLKGRSRRPTNVRTRTQGSWLMRNPKRKSQKVSQSVLANKPTKTTTTTTTGSLTLTTTISCA